MYVLTMKSVAPGVYGKDSIVGSDSMLKLQSRALKDARKLVALNPVMLEYDRKRKGGVITITVSRKARQEVVMKYPNRAYVIPSRDKSVIVTYTIRTLVTV